MGRGPKEGAIEASLGAFHKGGARKAALGGARKAALGPRKAPGSRPGPGLGPCQEAWKAPGLKGDFKVPF